MVRWLVAKGARVTPHELELAAFGGYELSAAQSNEFELCTLSTPAQGPCAASGALQRQHRGVAHRGLLGLSVALRDSLIQASGHSLMHLVCLGILNLPSLGV